MLSLSLVASAEPDVVVIRDTPAKFEEIQNISVNSRDSRARSRDAKQEYVFEEMQRQAAALGANAVLLTEVR